MNKMADHIEGAPGLFAFGAASPCIRQIAEKRIKSGGSASEQSDCVFQIMFHRFLNAEHRDSDGLDELGLAPDPFFVKRV